MIRNLLTLMIGTINVNCPGSRSRCRFYHFFIVVSAPAPVVNPTSLSRIQSGWKGQKTQRRVGGGRKSKGRRNFSVGWKGYKNRGRTWKQSLPLKENNEASKSQWARRERKGKKNGIRKRGRLGLRLAGFPGPAFFLPPLLLPSFSPNTTESPHKLSHIRNGWLHYSCHYRLSSHNSQRTPTSMQPRQGGSGERRNEQRERERGRERVEAMGQRGKKKCWR